MECQIIKICNNAYDLYLGGFNMAKFEIKDEEQLRAILYLKDDLIHVYNAMRFAKEIDYDAVKKIDMRIQSLNMVI